MVVCVGSYARVYDVILPIKHRLVCAALGSLNLFWGSFNNYVNQILPNFNPLPPRVDKHGHFKNYLSFVT